LQFWGDRVRDYLFGPRLTLTLVNERGDLTSRFNGDRLYYYHFRVTNGKRRIPGQGVRVVVQGISKRAPNAAFVQQPLVYPLQLPWTPMEPGELERTVVQQSICDFGLLEEKGNARSFLLAVPLVPTNFRGHVGRDGCVRYEVVATGQNVFSLQPTVFEVSWDGQWTENQEEMKRHLVIRTVSSL
jgi:hypothetical protein